MPLVHMRSHEPESGPLAAALPLPPGNGITNTQHKTLVDGCNSMLETAEHNVLGGTTLAVAGQSLQHHTQDLLYRMYTNHAGV